MLANRLRIGALESIRRVLFDKTVLGPITTVAGTLTMGFDGHNGGRKSVVLSNGWIVKSVYDSAAGHIKFLVSKDNDATYTQLCYAYCWTASSVNFAIETDGSNIFLLANKTNSTSLVFVKFDALTTGNVDVWLSASVIQTQNSFGAGCAIKIDSNGHLHISYASKNATYPNAFNIRYSKSTDLGTTWDAHTQITTRGSSPDYCQYPTMAIMADGNPIIAYVFWNGSNVYACQISRWTGSAWASSYAHTLGNYLVAATCITVSPLGVLHIVFHGADASIPSNPNIFYISSSNNGVTWSTYIKLTATSTKSQLEPVIAVNADENVFVSWWGANDVSPSYYRISSISKIGGVWGAITFFQAGATTHEQYPSMCDNFYNFDYPLLMWKSGTTGIYSVGAHYVGDIRYDRTRGVVVDSAGLTNGAGGRKVTHLSNGWIVSSYALSGIIYLRVSKDKMATWEPLCNTPSNVYTIWALASNGTEVYLAATRSDGNAINVYAFEATTQANVILANTGNATTTENGMDGVSIAVDASGAVHIGYTCKNSTYPNAFNVKYSKSINKCVTWATPTQLTTGNLVADAHTSPCIVIMGNGNPIILWQYASGTSNYDIYSIAWNGSVWGAIQYVHNGTTYVLAYPCATSDSTGKLKAVWHGRDAAEPVENIWYSESSNYGVSWSTPAKITTGSTYFQYQPSIVTDLNDDAHVMFVGTYAGSAVKQQLRYVKQTAGAWGAVQTFTALATDQGYAQTCENYHDFVEPITVWVDFTVNVKSRGKWYEESEAA